MFCEKCGKENEEIASFCAGCGGNIITKTNNQTIKKESKFGLFSLITSVVSSLLMFFLFVIGGIIELSTQGGVDEDSFVAMFIGLLIFLFIFLLVIGGVLGLIGIVQKEKNILFSGLGICISLATLFITFLLLILA